MSEQQGHIADSEADAAGDRAAPAPRGHAQSKRILMIDGGGIWGAFPAEMMRKTARAERMMVKADCITVALAAGGG